MKIHSLEDLKNYIDKNILPQLKSRTVILLSGEMGVGKTQFVRSFCELIGSQLDVSSPTFSIINEYESDLGVIHHVDLYRIESQDELYDTGFWEIFEKESGLIFIEWPSKLNRVMIPKGWQILDLTIGLEDNLESNHRVITQANI